MSDGLDPAQLPPWFSQLAEQADRWRGELERWMTPERQAQIRLAEEAFQRYEAIVKPALDEAKRISEFVRQTWLASTPANWHELEAEQLDIIDLVEESGISLMWAPRPDVIRALLAAAPKDRYLRLADFAAEILDDLDAVIADSRGVDVEGHADACAFAAEAVGAARGGHYTAAQALAACGLGQVLHAALGFERLGEAFKKFSATDVDDAAITLIKIALLEACTARSLENYDGHEVVGLIATQPSTASEISSPARTVWPRCSFSPAGYAS